MPIKFIGTGEHAVRSEFHPDRMASRILGMSDILAGEQAHEVRPGRGEAGRRALHQGEFTLDTRKQLSQVKSSDPSTRLGMLPGMGEMTEMMGNADAGDFRRLGRIIDSMTPARAAIETHRPEPPA